MARLILFYLGVSALLAAASEASTAGNETLRFFEEEAMVITASRREQSTHEVPMSVEVITAEEIRACGAVNIWDLFRFRAGMDAGEARNSSGGRSNLNNAGLRAIVAVRGFPDNNVNNLLVLIDGRSVFAADSNIVLWEQLPVQIQDIERIEIVRGPNAALYGSNAGVGVINIITKKPTDKFSVSGSGLWGTLGGDRHLHQETASLEQAIKSFNYRMSYTHRFDDGFPNANNDRNNDFTSSNKLNFRGIWAPAQTTKMDFSGGASWDNVGYNAQSFTPTSADRVASDFQMIKLSHDLASDSAVEGFVSRTESFNSLLPAFGSFDNPTTSGRRDSRYDAYDAEIQHRFGWMDGRMQTVWGGSWRDIIAYSDQLYDFPDAPHRVEGKTIRGFGSDSYKLFDKLTVLGALSLENSDFGGFAPAYQLAFVGNLNENHTLRAQRAVASAQRSAFRLHGLARTLSSSGKQGVVGNPDMKNEELSSWETSYQGDFLERHLRSEVNLYFEHNRGAERSRLNGTSFNGVPLTEYFPEDDTIARGVEAKLGYHWSKNRSVYVNYTFESITAWSADPGIQQGTPIHKANFGGMTPLGYGFSASLNVGYKDRYVARSGNGGGGNVVAAYWRMDARLAYSFRNIDLFVAGQNLTMPSHDGEFRGPDVPRLISSGASARF